MTKTNAMRLLDSAEIAYRTAEYAYDENDLSGVHAAAAIGMPAEQVFKTLVTRGDPRKHICVLHPGGGGTGYEESRCCFQQQEN